MTEIAAPVSEFDRAIALLPEGEARWALEVDAGFTVGPKPNGGYLLAAAAHAAARTLEDAGVVHVDPLAASAHYLWAPDPGPASVQVEVLRTGRSASQVRATIEQGDRPCVDATFTMGTLPDGNAPAIWSSLPPVALPPEEECFRLPARREGAPFEVPIMDRTDLRLDPACLGFGVGAPSGAGELRGWVRFADGRPIDPRSLLYFLDCFPPATFDIGPSGWVPTLSLTAYLRARPVPGPLLARQRVQVVHDQRVDEVCELWDTAGRLVGQATQLAAIRFDDESSLVPFSG
jgi:acyl-coenzyme A thioesterase PaaI-like protein